MRKKIKVPDVADARRQAGNVLARHGNRLLLIEALIALLIPAALYVFLNLAVSSLTELLFAREESVLFMFLVTTGYGLILILLTLFFILPLFLGLLKMTHGLIREEDVVLADLFSPFFTRTGYGRAIRLSWSLLWRAATVLLAVAAIAVAVPAVIPDPIGAVLLCGGLILAVLVLGLWWLLRQFPLFAVAMYEELSLSDARRVTRALTRGCPGGGVRFFVYFVPQICLGLLTFGIFLIWEVLPRMCASYLLYCNMINDKMIEIGGIENYE